MLEEKKRKRKAPKIQHQQDVLSIYFLTESCESMREGNEKQAVRDKKSYQLKGPLWGWRPESQEYQILVLFVFSRADPKIKIFLEIILHCDRFLK